jgi:hypothetical protein
MKKLLLALALATAAPAALAVNLEATAAQAEATQAPAITVWIDSNWGFRKQGAAADLNKAHKVFGAHGYDVLSVEPYIENGDLQGFFVTYKRR